MIIILDFGSQYTQLICRRVRELGVQAEIRPFNKLKKEELKKAEAFILSGSPASLNDHRSLMPNQSMISSGVPILGICYGMQVIAKMMGGVVDSLSYFPLPRPAVAGPAQCAERPVVRCEGNTRGSVHCGKGHCR